MIVCSYGRLTKYAVVRNAQVVEFEKFENAQQVLEVARTSPAELEIDGVSLMPVFSGLPKRNFEATKRKLQVGGWCAPLRLMRMQSMLCFVCSLDTDTHDDQRWEGSCWLSLKVHL